MEGGKRGRQRDGGGGGLMEGHSRRMKESQKERRCRNKKNKKRIRICSRYIFSKTEKPSVCSGLGFVWIKRIVHRQ